MSAFVCLSVRDHISGTTRPIFTKFLCVLQNAIPIPILHTKLLLFIHLAHRAAESRHRGLNVLLLFLIYFLTRPVSQTNYLKT